MSESVFDASFITTANGLLAGERPGNLLNRRLAAIRSVTLGHSRIRYNQKLLNEYTEHVIERRNDILDQFFELLDSDSAIRSKGSTLRKADKAKAIDCKWPLHDQHVLAAAIGGTDVVIHITENSLACCSAKIKRVFGFKINHVA